jgi:hypothetical protein
MLLDTPIALEFTIAPDLLRKAQLVPNARPRERDESGRPLRCRVVVPSIHALVIGNGMSHFQVFTREIDELGDDVWFKLNGNEGRDTDGTGVVAWRATIASIAIHALFARALAEGESHRTPNGGRVFDLGVLAP